MKLFKTKTGVLLQQEDHFFLPGQSWDELINRDELHAYLLQQVAAAKRLDPVEAENMLKQELLPPIGDQEVWAAGVTYLRSKSARMDESKDSGAADLYSKVYDADRPELFFKSMPHRVVGHGGKVNIRRDSTWNVPEPELTLYINAAGKIQGYTIGNDMSSRSIEGENALYLPQAKIYENSAALGPCLYVPSKPLNGSAIIAMKIWRDDNLLYDDSASIDRMKRKFEELVAYLYKECNFKEGCFLMTGTCLVPSSDFSLREDDRVEIMIEGIGTLINNVGVKN